MRKVFNFSAGPAMLPEEVLTIAQQEMLDWHGMGMSIMEMGHRGPEFEQVALQAEKDLRELMSIPDHYHVLFLAGGATTQFAMVPLNLLGKNKKADYIDTGIWSRKAIAEAERYGTINIAAKIDLHESLYRLPLQSKWSLSDNAAYVHYTPNETIDGVEFHWVPNTGDIPLVADMTSNILSRTLNINDYGIIYAGAQKNAGQAGITLVIVRDDLIHHPLPYAPSLYQYKVQADSKGFYNTPPTYSWYIAGLTLAWMKRQGGVAHFEALNQRKSDKLYQVIDAHKDFYINRVHVSCRSRMNVSFDLNHPRLTQLFLEEATQNDLTNLKGHKVAGGIRASIYNPMPEEGVDKLVEFMKNFVKKYG